MIDQFPRGDHEEHIVRFHRRRTPADVARGVVPCLLASGLREVAMLAEGDRVRLSEEGRRVCSRSRPDRTGVVVRVARDGRRAYVVWDGLNAWQRYAISYLALVGRSHSETTAGRRLG